MDNNLIGRRVGDEKTIDARSIYNAAIQRGLSHAESTKLVEAIMQAEAELMGEDEELTA